MKIISWRCFDTSRLAAGLFISDAGDQLDSGCAQPDRYVKVTGDVSQDYALEYIERTSPQWAATARLFGDKVKMDHQ